MKITVRVKTNAKKDEVKKEDETHYSAHINAPALTGKANGALIKVLSHYFNIAQSRIHIVSGFFSRIKIIEIK